MQLGRTRVDDKALVAEYLVYLDEERFRMRWANLQNVGTTAGFPFEHVEGVKRDGRGRGCEWEECRETVRDVKRSRKGLVVVEKGPASDR